MSTPQATRTPLSDEQLHELVELIKDADSVELKLSIPGADRRSTIAALGIDALDAFIRQVYFFDTPELDLNGAGVVVRARRSQGKPDDSVVKLRPVVPADLPAELRARDQFGVEVDALPGGYVCSASFKHKHDSDDLVKDALAGEPEVSRLFSKHQRAFYAEHAPDALELEQLSILGPVHVFKLKFSPEGYDRKLVAELWLYPDGSQILELSTKCAPNEAFQVAAETRAYLAGLGVNLFGEQETKTRTALEFFAADAAEGSR